MIFVIRQYTLHNNDILTKWNFNKNKFLCLKIVLDFPKEIPVLNYKYLSLLKKHLY